MSGLSGRNSTGYTPLALAAACGNSTLVEFLIKAGAKLNEPGFNGVTALTLSINGSHCRVAQMLIVEGANANTASMQRLDLFLSESLIVL